MVETEINHSAKTAAMLQNVGFMRSTSQPSFVESQAMNSHSFLAKDRVIPFLDGDNTSQTEENGKTTSPLQPEYLGNKTFSLGPFSHVNNEPESSRENEDFTRHLFSHSLDAFQIVTHSNESTQANWTVRNSEGYQQELIKEECGSYNLSETNIDLGNKAGESPQNICSLLGYESDIDNIMVHLILSFPEPVDGEVWHLIQSSLKISQSVAQHDYTLPLPRTSVSCDQRSEEIPISETKLAREISAFISVRHHLNSTSAQHLFQLYLAIKEKSEAFIEAQYSWTRLNILAFIHFPSTGQLLLPIEREVCRREALDSIQGTFLGSFLMENKQIFHHSPNEHALRRRETSTSRNFTQQSSKFCADEVIIVDRKDMVLEPNGARAGRPSHKETGQLLMTVSQVEKVLEIRKRWEGLSSRQRRDNISSSDLYTFLTLNRDETAEYLGVCATWLKDAIRAQGMNVWPGRPLRKTGAMLQTLKESLESAKAALRFSDPTIDQTEKYEADVQRYENEIRDLVSMRAEIVKANVSTVYFKRFMRERGSRYLDPQWNALPPPPLR